MSACQGKPTSTFKPDNGQYQIRFNYHAQAVKLRDYCRVEAHKQVRRRRDDFDDVPLPGLEDWGL